MKLSKITKLPGGISSLRDPHAVETIIWVQPRDFNAQMLAL